MGAYFLYIITSIMLLIDFKYDFMIQLGYANLHRIYIFFGSKIIYATTLSNEKILLLKLRFDTIIEDFNVTYSSYYTM